MKYKAQWSEINSIRITKLFIILVLMASVVMCILGPKITEYIMLRTSPLLQGETRFWVILIGGYLCAVVLFIFLIMMYALILRIEAGEVFTEKNVRALHNISLLVLIACIMTIVIGLTCCYAILVISATAAFVVPVIRVIKNAFGKAVEMKQELDLTV